MNIYDQIKEHLPKEKEFSPVNWGNEIIMNECTDDTFSIVGAEGYNQGLNAVFEVLKRCGVDEKKVVSLIFKVNGEIGKWEEFKTDESSKASFPLHLAKEICTQNIITVGGGKIALQGKGGVE